MMMPDVNVLLGAFWRRHAAHEDFARVLTRLADGPEPFALSELVLSAFVRIATTRTIVVRETNCRGKVVADAYHAALAIEHGCEWLTADADFMRFKDLRVRHPLRPR
ncbi:MAG: PIN domain-containing protein [Myxococcota bacterium]